ncbi:uncharacterized protein klhdc7a [Mustelus asterias]
MEFAAKAIVSAALVVTLTLIYRCYKLRAVNAARSRVPESSDGQELSESREKGQGVRPLQSSQGASREENTDGPMRHIEADQHSKKPEPGSQSLELAAEHPEKERVNPRATSQLSNGRGIAKGNWLKAKVRRLGAFKQVRNRLATTGVTEPRVKAPTLNPATALISGECAVRTSQAEGCDKLDNNESSESAGEEGESSECILTLAKQDCSNNISSQTYFEQELDVCSNDEPQPGQESCPFDVLSAGLGAKITRLPANSTATPRDHLISPASDAIKRVQDTLVGNQPTELAGNEMLEGRIDRQGTAGSSGEHENISSSACKLYPGIKMPSSNAPSVQSTYRVEHEKAKAGNGSEGGPNLSQLCVEVNLSDNEIISTSDGNEDRDRSSSCSITQVAKDPTSLDVGNLKLPACQCQAREQAGVYCSLGSGQGTVVPSQSMTGEVVNSPVSDWRPSEHPNVSSSCSAKSAAQTIMEERTVLRKDSISAIAETPSLLIDFHSETRDCSERSHSSQLNSRAPSVDDLSSSSLGSLVDSLYLSQPDLSKETPVEVVARANFIQIPLNNQSTVEVMKCRLDLGNCYEILCVAKKHDLKDLQDAAYQVMSDNYLQVLKNPNIYGQLKADERELILARRTYGRRYLMVADVDVQENVWAKTTVQANREGVANTARPQKPSQSNHKLYYYKEENDSWYPLVNMTVESISKDCALCTMFNYLFVVAGCQGIGREIKLSNKVFCYNPVTNIWSEIRPLNQARPNCKLVALDGYLYAIGGECLSTVERYDPRMDRWIFTAPLPQGTFTITHKATVCSGEIYVTRGTFYYQLLKYNAREDTWNVCTVMSRKDKTTDIAAVKNFIYRFEINQHFGISVHRYHIITKIGEECATKSSGKLAPFQCVVVDDTIYCVNKQFLMQFVAQDVSPYFRAEGLTALPGAKGILFPFVLTLPERDSLQTPV